MSNVYRPGAIDRVLRPFAEVRAGEGANALILAFNVFLLLTAYYILKPLRDGLILGERGPEFTAYMSAAMAFLLVPVIAGYGKLADRFPRRRLINIVTLFFAACCVVFFLVGAVWYGALFRSLWQREAGVGDPPQGAGAAKVVLGTLLGEFLVVAMLGHLFARTQPADHVKLMMAAGFALAVMAPAMKKAGTKQSRTCAAR